MVTFTVNGQEAGAELKWEKGTLQVKVEAEAESHIPMSSIELVVNGQVVETEKARKDGKRVRLKKGLEVTDSCWMAVRVRGEAHRLLTNDDALYAHTSPVYLSFKDRPVRSHAAAQFFVEQIDQLIQLVHDRGQFSHEREKQKTVDLFRKGQDVYRAMLDEEETEAVPVRFGHFLRVGGGLHFCRSPLKKPRTKRKRN